MLYEWLPSQVDNNYHYTAPMFQQYFDTNKFVQKLETEGFSRQQGEAIMESLAEVMNERYAYLPI